jgi:hypothetical protein
MFELPTQPASIALEFANVRGILCVKHNHNDTDREIIKNECEDLGEFTLSCDIDEDNLDCQQVVLYLDQTCCEKKI